MKLSRANTLLLMTGALGLMGMPQIIKGEESLRSTVRKHQNRRLDTKRCFAEVTGMHSSHAVSAIQADLAKHPFPVEVIVHQGRTEADKKDSYFEVGIPVNLNGEVKCDIKDGTVRGPATWEVSRGVVATLPTVDCTGLFIIGCCDKYMTAVTDLGIPLTDVNGKCLSCWAYQDHLEPFMSDTTGSLAYLDTEYVDGVCKQTEFSLAHVQGEDIATQSYIDDFIANTIQPMIDNQKYHPTCYDLKHIHDVMIEKARSLSVAMTKISSMLCGFCELAPGNTDPPSKRPSVATLTELVKYLQKKSVKSDRNVLVVYTNSDGNVLQPPTIGGRGHGGGGRRQLGPNNGAKCTEEDLVAGEENLSNARAQWRINERQTDAQWRQKDRQEGKADLRVAISEWRQNERQHERAGANLKNNGN